MVLNSVAPTPGAGHVRPNEAVPGDERGQLVLAHPLRSFRALGEDEVAKVGDLTRKGTLTERMVPMEVR